MPPLQDEIRRTRPFEVIEEEAMLSILRTAEVLGQATAEFVKPYNLTATQYNVLRILRGAGPSGIPANEIAARMVNRDPDVTRLLHRLEARGLAERERGTPDRRVVLARITNQGLSLLEQMDVPIVEHLKSQLGHLGPQRLSQLIALLAECRRNPSSPPLHR